MDSGNLSTPTTVDDSHPSGLTHVSGDGRVRMVDVGKKAESARTAIAEGALRTTPAVAALVAADGVGKADVLATARLAGIGAAKRTSELIPLCHQIPLHSVVVDFEIDAPSGEIRIRATARTSGRTGVEMEALTAVAVSGLALHDMVKAVDPLATIDGVRLVAKSGGKRGNWTRSDPEPSAFDDAEGDFSTGRTALVLVASTTAAHGTRVDSTGPTIERWLLERGFSPVRTHIVADDSVGVELAALLRRSPAMLVTTGGTGVSPDDNTPEATRPHLDIELPGLAEAIRARGLAATPTAALSRGLAGFAGRTLVVNLPGSAGGVSDGLAVLNELVDHLLEVHEHGGGH